MTTAVDGTGGFRRRFIRPADAAQKWPALALAVFLAAVLARVVPPLAGGGLTGNYGYDAGVYFASSDAFAHARLPYRDFTLLHPPLLMLMLTPFTLLARLVGDQAAFIAGNLAFAVLGGINAVLVVRVARRMGLSSVAAGVAGAFYALWYGSVQAEDSIRLEPLGNLFILLGLLAALASRTSPARRWPLLCGLALGAACSVKIWSALPLVLILGWQIAGDASRRRRARWAIGGAALALTVVNGPFFFLAPNQMLHQVVLDQFGRPYQRPGPLVRLHQLVGIGRLVPTALITPTLVVVLAIVAAAALRAWRVPYGRALLLITALELMVLLSTPHWGGYYGDYLAPTGALLAGAAAMPAPATQRNPIRQLRTVVAGTGGGVRRATAAAVLVALAWISLTAHTGTPFPGRVLARSVAGLHCVMADSPMALINLNVLSRDLHNGCRNWVDVSGRTYGPDALRRPNGRFYPRPNNPVWQRDLAQYLLSGNALIVVRPETGISATTLARLHRGGRLACALGHCIYRVHAPARH